MVNDKRTGEAGTHGAYGCAAQSVGTRAWVLRGYVHMVRMIRAAGGSGQAERYRSPRNPTHGGSFAFRKKGTKFHDARKRVGTRSACSSCVRPLWIPRIAIAGGMGFTSRKIPCGRAGIPTRSADRMRPSVCPAVLLCGVPRGHSAGGRQHLRDRGSKRPRIRGKPRPRAAWQRDASAYRGRSTRSLGESLFPSNACVKCAGG